MAETPGAFSMRAYFDQVYAGLRPAFSFTASSRPEWEAWRAGLRARLTELLGGFPAERGPLNPRVVERVELERYVREKVIFDSEPGMAIPAYLLLPKTATPARPAPAMLCLHGHGRGKLDVVGLAGSLKERQQKVRSANYDYGHQFAERGYVVLAPDARAFGELATDGMTCTWAMTAALLMGKVLVGLRVWDAMRGIDYLQARPEVDPGRIGCAGLSWGGTHTLYTAALDDRIKVAIISGYFDTFKDNLIDSGQCACQYVPNLLLAAECTDLTALIAPRPLLIENGLDDPLYTLETVQAEYAKLQRAYSLLAAADRLDLDLFPGAHRWSGRKAYDWVARWL